MLENFVNIGVLSVVSIKCYLLFYKHRVDLIKIIAKLEEFFPKSGIDQKTFNIEKHRNKIKKFGSIINGIYLSMVIDFILIPVMYKLYGWISSYQVDWVPVHTILFPFDQKSPFVFWSLHFLYVWTASANLLTFNVTDLFFASMTNVLSMEFKILAQIIGDIDLNDDEKTEESAIKELKTFVDVHEEFNQIALELDNIFAFLLFVNVFASISFLCVYVFLFFFGISYYLLTKYFVCFIGVFIQVYVYCYFGDRLAESSNGVANGVYNSAWYKASPKYRKMAMMIMKRAQREQKIRAWKFADINLNTFYWIITTAYSYYSFLVGVYEV
ncbi:hypothetical protein PVAND_016985 [Polypedilum vanderplanki]|uniref:Odorant receptor n=2 Tax=Polypedilum vanderplanki TaxID=319348 RepID=A0A9J6BHN8_POLVA|nr:hypothetical protein PVAND_016985 [Polypedilum vanderplanki]